MCFTFSFRFDIFGNRTVRKGFRNVLGLLGSTSLLDSLVDEARHVALDKVATACPLGALDGCTHVVKVFGRDTATATLLSNCGKLVNHELLSLVVLKVVAEVTKPFGRFTIVGIRRRIDRHEVIERLRFVIFFRRQTKIQLATKRLQLSLRIIDCEDALHCFLVKFCLCHSNSFLFCSQIGSFSNSLLCGTDF